MTYIQWTQSDNKFFPVGKTTDILPPGCYRICESMQGLYLEKQVLRNNALLKLPDDSTTKVVSEIKKFWESKEKFESHNMPYKRGILMYGPPGSGKTSTVRSIMEDVSERGGIVLEFDHPSMFLEGYKMIREVHPNTPIVSIMEDVDSIVERCSESQFVNVLDGVHDMSNIVFVATTNYPEKLSSRIFNRPSRFDKKFMVGMPSAESRKMYFEHKGVPTELLETWVEDTSDLSLAHLAELYTAVNVFNEDYGEAVKIIKGMNTIPHSSLFDDSKVVATEDYEQPYEKCKEGYCYMEAKKAASKSKNLFEDALSDLDKTKPKAKNKAKKPLKLIKENNEIDDISKLI